MRIIDRVKNIITTPATEWIVISAEQPDINKIIGGYVVPLAGLEALAAFIGYGFIGISAFGTRYTGYEWGVYQALNIFINAIASVYISSLVVDALAPSFGSEKNFGRSVQLIAYSYTPAFVGGLLAIFPPIAFLG